MNNKLINGFYDKTYDFIQSDLLSFCNWDEFEEIIFNRQQERANTCAAWIDVLPALISHLGSEETDQAIHLAAAWTLYLFAGRILDDIQDNEGYEQPWFQDGSEQALPTASFVLGLAQMALARLKGQSQIDILDAFGRTLALASKAQREQQSPTNISIDEYFQNLVSRTAVAFATASWAGARLATTDPKILDAAYNYGLSVGIAIQIEDDCRDLASSDFAAGIYTLPVIYALSQTQHPCHPNLLALISTENDVSAASVTEIVEILEGMSAFKWSRKMAAIHRKKSLEIMNSIFPGTDKNELQFFALGKC